MHYFKIGYKDRYNWGEITPQSRVISYNPSYPYINTYIHTYTVIPKDPDMSYDFGINPDPFLFFSDGIGSQQKSYSNSTWMSQEVSKWLVSGL